MTTKKVLTMSQINNTCNPHTNKSIMIGNERVIWKKMGSNRNKKDSIQAEINQTTPQQITMNLHSRKAITKATHTNSRYLPKNTINFTLRNPNNMINIKTNPKAFKRSHTTL